MRDGVRKVCSGGGVSGIGRGEDSTAVSGDRFDT